MNRKHWRAPLWLCIALVAPAFVGCGDDSDAVTPNAPGKNETGAEAGKAAGDGRPRAGSAGPCSAGTFDSTFAAIQKVVFEGGKCTNDMCHGAAANGGLDLRAGVSYQNLVQRQSKSSPQLRVMPAEPYQSFLYNKLRAATEPGSVKIEGSPMPNGSPALSPEHLEVVRRWIEAGAPREGSVGDDVTGQSDGIAKLLGSGACLPEATPIAIAPLEPPAVDEGAQLLVAPVTVKAQSEIDVCWAQYYDLSDVVPRELQDPERGIFYVNGQRTRQDPLSHHLVVSDSGLGAESVNDPAFGKWSCRGDDSKGEPCDPLQKNACGSGQCASEVQAKTACQGFGPTVKGRGLAFGEGLGRITGSQTAQYYRAPREGVYETVPIKGIMYVNPHAFNLTNRDAQLRGWINLFYAKGDIAQQHELQLVNILGKIAIASGTPPFTQKTYCATWEAPRNSAMYSLSSHTHKRGHHFTVDLPDGTRIYTNEIYSDPVVEAFDPPMRFDASDPADRTLTYCADFNNGVNGAGQPDIDLVTRLSTMPERTTCTPVACVAGQIGAACAGADDSGACDSSAGAGDGWCDACPITGGQTTENEMFIMIPMMVLP